MTKPVIIVDYDPLWPLLYKEEEIRTLGVMGHKVLAIEHIGSTAVPGLGAKPIIDIMVCLHDSSDADGCIPLLKDLGYKDVTRQKANPDWFYCLGKDAKGVGYHLHLMRYMSSFSMKHLLFWNCLLTHPESAQKYYELKKELAAKYGSDRVAYNESKRFHRIDTFKSLSIELDERGQS